MGSKSFRTTANGLGCGSKPESPRLSKVSLGSKAHEHGLDRASGLGMIIPVAGKCLLVLVLRPLAWILEIRISVYSILCMCIYICTYIYICRYILSVYIYYITVVISGKLGALNAHPLNLFGPLEAMRGNLERNVGPDQGEDWGVRPLIFEQETAKGPITPGPGVDC